MGRSRDENILENILGATNPLEPPRSRIERLLLLILENGGGGGGGGGTGGVIMFNGRNGIVTSAAGDYTASQVNTRTAGKNVETACAVCADRKNKIAEMQRKVRGKSAAQRPPSVFDCI